MRDLIDIIVEAQAMDEECVAHDAIKKASWEEWQDRDGIVVMSPGTETAFVGFDYQDEAQEYARKLGPEWQVVRCGRYRDLSDEEANADPDIRQQRIKWGFYVEPEA